MKKRRRRWWLFVVIAALAIAAGVAVDVFWVGPHDSAPLRYLTATAGKGTIARTVQADFTLASASSAASSASQSASSSSSSSTSSSSSASSSNSSSTGVAITSSQTGVVTRLHLAVGQAPRTLERLLSVSGLPVYAFVSSRPLYENLSVDLSSGEQKANVKVLQRALKAAGDYTGTVDGQFGSGTQTALEAWQADEGQSQTGVIDTSSFVWVPKGAVLTAWQVDLGSQLSGQASVATVDFPRRLEAQALVGQADIASLKIGQKVQLTIDGYSSQSFNGTITYIDSQASSSSSSSSSGAEYSVTVSSQAFPTFAKSGMSGTLEVTLAKRANVLLVPTRAVSGSAGTPYVQVMIDGKPVYRQVSTGMTTASLTQITSGLTAGEVVVTGRYSTAAASTSSGNGGGLGLFGGGGFRRQNNGSAGSSGGGTRTFVPSGGGQ
jgi:peptidoglycan hydrolase-like protein with peptidoglycan-binding domain